MDYIYIVHGPLPLAILRGRYQIVHGPFSVGHTPWSIPWWTIVYSILFVGHTWRSISWTIVHGTLSVGQVDTMYCPWFIFHWSYSAVNTMDYSPCSTFYWPYSTVNTI